MYFDYAATSLKRRDVIDKLINDIDSLEGNPSSIHALGKKSKWLMDQDRKSIASHIGARADQVIFTSGATEANNTIIKMFEEDHTISSNIEHKSVLVPLSKCPHVTLVEAGPDGLVNVEDIMAQIKETTKLVCLMYVNNETGSIQPVKELGQKLKDRGIWYHIDGVQALGHLDINVDDLACDSLSLSGHKIGGLNGLGVLYIRDKVKPLILGGSQEQSLRAGTSNAMAVRSMAASLDLIDQERDQIRDLKSYFIEKLEGLDYEINGDLETTTDHIVNVYFPWVKSDLMLTYLDMNGVYVSAGSACNSNTLEPSYVIEAMYDADRASHSIRFSFGFSNDKDQVDKLIDLIEQMYKKKNRKE